MKIARVAAIAVAIALIAADAAQAWIPPHLLVPRPTEEVSAVQPVAYVRPVPLRAAPELEGEAAFGAADTNAGERLVALRERELGALDRDVGELAGDDKLAEAMRKCIRGMLAGLNEETMQSASQTSEHQDTLLGALGQSIMACFKENVEGPAAQIISMAQNLTDQQKQLAQRRLPQATAVAPRGSRSRRATPSRRPRSWILTRQC
jgi:hypothetical protein